MGKNPGSGTGTNNTSNYFNLKVDMRLESLPDSPVKVLECFAGEGKLWDAVQKRFNHHIKRTRIDINEYPGTGNIKGDSLRIIIKINLDGYDLIDLDSWGSPISHLDVIFKREWRGIVHCTYCCPIPLNPQKKLARVYYKMDNEVIKEKPSIFAKNLEEMILKYMFLNGVKDITGYLSPKHNYFYFNLDK